MSKRAATTLVLVVIIFFICVQAGVIIWAFFEEGFNWFWMGLVIVVPLVIIIWLFGVYRERLKEIREEEGDDLSRY